MSRTVLNLTCHLKKTPQKSFFHAHAESCEFTIDHAEWCVFCIITCRVVWFIIAHADTYVMVQFLFIFLFHMQSHEIQYFIANKIKCLEHSLSSTCIKQSYSNIKSVLKSLLQVIFWHRLFHSLILLLALKQVFSGLPSLMGFMLM